MSPQSGTQKYGSHFKGKSLVIALSALVLVAACVGSNGTKPKETNNEFVTNARLPKDVDMTCTVSDDEFKNWFYATKVAANGAVTAADSTDSVFADFSNNTRCDFYRWGARMFLWMTTANENYHVFNTPPQFYDVSVESNSQRQFIASDGTLAIGLRDGKDDESIELGQAGADDVLLSQKKSLVYYSIYTNDAFAMYRTAMAVKNGDTSLIANLSKTKQAEIKLLAETMPDKFPYSGLQMLGLDAFSSLYGRKLVNPKTMILELKISWVDADTVAKRDDYILTQATVPVFNRTEDPTKWKNTGETENKTLAMVGFHIGGTLEGHPEMIWSTFEHVSNLPDNSYSYYTNEKKKTTNTQSFDASEDWLFFPKNGTQPDEITANAKVNHAEGSTSATEIVSSGSADIGPVDVYRVNPWGNVQNEPKLKDATLENNTDLVSINKSILSKLAKGDLRGNYLQVGGIWSAKGQIPTGYPDMFPPSAHNDPTDTYFRGSLFLANTTMETFFQYQNNIDGAVFHANCFSCHNSGKDQIATNVSHIFEALQPLEARNTKQ
ncbi:hypothetical protein [Planctobacterium marinum]|uniref:hypothetical protein n=1 Tax=Planctobacterium marinum TaxID=1631968 RepID=UPI001E524BA9|nr:hypothetical protein [Planctobacterium marinum]MCC2605085.1 hypothetical protein [Planctobacterium marinum]